MRRFGKMGKFINRENHFEPREFFQSRFAEDTLNSYTAMEEFYDYSLFQKLKQSNKENMFNGIVQSREGNIRKSSHKMTRLSELEAANLYHTLNLHENCSFEEIRKAYKKLCVVCHPDKGGNACEFTRIQEAYKILSTPLTRKIFDTFGTRSIKVINEILISNQLEENESINLSIQQGDFESLACLFQVNI